MASRGLVGDISLIAFGIVIYVFMAHQVFLVYVLASLVVFSLIFRMLKFFRGTHSWLRAHRSNFRTIDAMSGLEFERYVAGLLRAQGFTKIKLTDKYDFGIDIIANKEGVRWGIQVKRYSGLVKVSTIRQVVSALKKYDCDKAMVVTNSYFSRVAKELAQCNECILIDRKTLVKWC